MFVDKIPLGGVFMTFLLYSGSFDRWKWLTWAELKASVCCVGVRLCLKTLKGGGFSVRCSGFSSRSIITLQHFFGIIEALTGFCFFFSPATPQCLFVLSACSSLEDGVQTKP